MIRYRISALLAAAVLVTCTGCGSGGSAESTFVASEQEQSAVVQYTAAELLDKLSESGLCPELNERAELGGDTFDNACENLYGEAADKFYQGGIMFVGSGALADEVSVLASESADCAEILEQRRQRRYKDFEGYAPEEMEKIENAEIFSAGGMTVLVISDRAEEIRRLIE